VQDAVVVDCTTMAVTEAGLFASRELDSLYRRHGAEIYRYALAVLGNHADAEDVTQTTFLNAYRALEQGVRPRKPSNWLLTIASNVIKQRFRQEQAKPRQVELDRDLAKVEHDEDVPTVGEVLTALSKIPPQQRQAIVLREFEGRSYKEIADILEITTSALETLLFRARRSLAEELTHHLTCTEALQAISRAADGRLPRKERRRLREHLAECPDCAQFARAQQRHRRALRGLALIPIPLSLSLFKGLEGSAAAASLTLAAGSTAGSVGAGGIGSGGVGAGAAASSGGAAAGGAAATGGGVFAGGLAVKAAAVVAAASVAGGATVAGVKEIEKRTGNDSPPPARVTKSGKAVPVRDHGMSASDRAQEQRKAIARGRTGTLPPGLAKKSGEAGVTSAPGRSGESNGNGQSKKADKPANTGNAGNSGNANGDGNDGGNGNGSGTRSGNANANGNGNGQAGAEQTKNPKKSSPQGSNGAGSPETSPGTSGSSGNAPTQPPGPAQDEGASPGSQGQTKNDAATESPTSAPTAGEPTGEAASDKPGKGSGKP
jgi:RNA polymerase sigma factor (sigma-70 family)